MDVRRTIATLLPALALALAACSGGSSSPADPTPSFSDPPSSSAPPDPPKQESPEHFIRRWVDVEKRMENTGATAQYLRLSSSCQACRKLARTISGFYAAGGYVKWGGWQIRSIESNASDSSSHTYAVVNDSSPTEYRKSADGSVSHLSGGRSTELLTLKRGGGSWTVVDKAELAS